MDRNMAGEYINRINKVTDYIDSNLGREMTLKELSNVAGFSQYHFHRIFAAMTGETLFSFITRLRLERAASQLCALHNAKTITQIAQDLGFSSSAVFSRAFKKRFLRSPTQFRNSNQCQEKSSLGKLLRNDGKASPGEGGYTELAPMGNAAEQHLGEQPGSMKQWRFGMEPIVKIEKLETKRVAYIRYVGPYAGDAQLFENLYRRMGAWTGPRGIDMSTSYIMYHDDPGITDEQKLRLSVCVPIEDDVVVSGEICEMTMQGGDHAVGTFELGTDEYGQAWNYMFAKWLPTSGYQPAGAPSFERYVGDGSDEGGKMKVDICIPVEVM